MLTGIACLQASAFLMFPDVYSACTAASGLRDQII